MEVDIKMVQGLTVDYTFTGDSIAYDDCWDVVDGETLCMEEAGYKLTYEDEVWMKKEGDTFDTIELNQIWSKPLDGETSENG